MLLQHFKYFFKSNITLKKIKQTKTTNNNYILKKISEGYSFQSILHDWYYEGRGICCHIKDVLLLIRKSSPQSGSSRSLLTIWVVLNHIRRHITINVLRKIFLSFLHEVAVWSFGAITTILHWCSVSVRLILIISFFLIKIFLYIFVYGYISSAHMTINKRCGMCR